MSKNPNKSRVFNGSRTVTHKKGVTPSGKAYEANRTKDHITGEVSKYTQVERSGGINRKRTNALGHGDSIVRRESLKAGKIGGEKYTVNKTKSKTVFGGVNYHDRPKKVTYVGKKGRTK